MKLREAIDKHKIRIRMVYDGNEAVTLFRLDACRGPIDDPSKQKWIETKFVLTNQSQDRKALGFALAKIEIKMRGIEGDAIDLTKCDVENQIRGIDDWLDDELPWIDDQPSPETRNR